MDSGNAGGYGTCTGVRYGRWEPVSLQRTKALWKVISRSDCFHGTVGRLVFWQVSGVVRGVCTDPLMTLTGILTPRGLDCSGDSALPPLNPGLELGRAFKPANERWRLCEHVCIYQLNFCDNDHILVLPRYIFSRLPWAIYVESSRPRAGHYAGYRSRV